MTMELTLYTTLTGPKRFKPQCIIKSCIIWISILHILSSGWWLRTTEAAPRVSSLVSDIQRLNTSTYDRFEFMGDDGANSRNIFSAFALRGDRIKNSMHTSSRDRDLMIYDMLWRSQIDETSRSRSKIEVLGDVLKKHVSRLRRVENGQVELVFLVDSSASVGLENFFNELKFVKKLLADFTVAIDATRVVVITFSSSHRVVANVDQVSVPNPNKHKCSLLNEELPSITYVGGGTYTKGALELAEVRISYIV